MRWLVWLRERWNTTKHFRLALVTAALVAAFVTTLYGVSQARNGRAGPTVSTHAASAAATSTSGGLTDSPPISGPTPTPIAGGHPVIPSNGTGPFAVQSITLDDHCMLWQGNQGTDVDVGPGGPCPEQTICSNYSLTIHGFVSMDQNAPNGDYTYRWVRSDGAATAPMVGHYIWGDPNYADNPVYTYTPSPTSVGQPFWVQLEVLAPNVMISLPSPKWEVNCLPDITGASAFVAPGSPTFYDCAQGGSQSFSFSGTVALVPSPSFTFSYYWLRYDGSTTPTQTVVTQAGATSYTVNSDSITPAPPPYQVIPPSQSVVAIDVPETLVVLNAPGVNGQRTIQASVWPPVTEENVCPVTPTPNPTATPTTPPPPTPTP